MRFDAEKFLTDVSGRYAGLYAAAARDLFVAVAAQDRVAQAAARAKMDDVVRETMGVGEVLGASLVLQRSAGVYADGVAFKGDRDRLVAFSSAPTQQLLPRVTLSEAVEDMVERAPVTIRRAAERTAQAIAKLYSEGRVVAFAKAAEETVTAAAQQELGRLIREGAPVDDAGKLLVEAVEKVRVDSEPWTEAYGRMAFRTNLNTAVCAGRFRQVQDPDIKAVIPAFMFSAVLDSDVRPNHAAADGIVLAVDDVQWARIAPPLGYSCRCEVHLVSRPELEDMGRMRGGTVISQRVPAAAHPDPGFRHGGRPDLFGVG